MGCSPYFAVTGSHPILPFDLAEANCLAPPTDFPISTADLIWQRAEALQNRYQAVQELREGKYAERIANALEFEKKFDHRIKDYHFEAGSVVLMRDSAIAKSLNSKAAPRYKGPLVVISRNRGGAYILAELNGVVMDHPIAAHRVRPFFGRGTPLTIPENALDVTPDRIAQMAESTEEGEHDAESEALAWLEEQEE